jgi:hypothetical protein
LYFTLGFSEFMRNRKSGSKEAVDKRDEHAGSLAEEYLQKAHMRLFASFDMVGSTSFKKQLANADEEPWILVFESFYRSLPKQLWNAYDHLMPTYCRRPPYSSTRRLRMFKTIGDEILFDVEIKRHEEVLFHIHAIKETTVEVNRRLAERYPSLQVKTTAWLAGFPVTNAEIQIANAQGSEPFNDYIGPSMDVGFRLTKWSTARKFVISYDLASMIVDALEPVVDESKKPIIFFDGSYALPGVLNEALYPIIWIDNEDNRPPLSERLRGTRQDPCVLHELGEYCRIFREKHKLWRWFIKEDPHPNYRGPSGDWLERYAAIKAKRENLRDELF